MLLTEQEKLDYQLSIRILQNEIMMIIMRVFITMHIVKIYLYGTTMLKILAVE